MYTSKLKIKTSSVNIWRSPYWWSGLSDCLVTSSISKGRPQKKPADCNCWDDNEARREDLGWQSEGVVWRRHWIQTGRGRRGTGVLGCADSWTPWGPAWTRPAPVHWANVFRYVRVATSHGRTCVYRWPQERRHSARVAACQSSLLERRPIQHCSGRRVMIGMHERVWPLNPCPVTTKNADKVLNVLTDLAQTLLCSPILSRIDYCNVLLQQVQNNAARIVLQAPRRSNALQTALATSRAGNLQDGCADIQGRE